MCVSMYVCLLAVYVRTCVACRAQALALALILTPMISLACLLRADSYVTATHLTKGQRKERERDMETVIQPCPLVSLLTLVISDVSDITSPVTRVHHHSPNRHWHSSPLYSSSLVSSILSYPRVSDHLFLSLLKFLHPFVAHLLNLTSLLLSTLSLHMLGSSLFILTLCLPAFTRVL